MIVQNVCMYEMPVFMRIRSVVTRLSMQNSGSRHASLSEEAAILTILSVIQLKGNFKEPPWSWRFVRLMILFH